MGIRVRLIPIAAALLVATTTLTACRIDGGQDGASASPPASAEASNDAPDETPRETTGTDYPY